MYSLTQPKIMVFNSGILSNVLWRLMVSTTPSPLVKTADFDVSEHQFVAYSEKNMVFLDHKQWNLNFWV